jgi:hypothetical protein
MIKITSHLSLKEEEVRRRRLGGGKGGWRRGWKGGAEVQLECQGGGGVYV